MLFRSHCIEINEMKTAEETKQDIRDAVHEIQAVCGCNMTSHQWERVVAIVTKQRADARNATLTEAAQLAADAAESLVKRGRYDTFADWSAEVERVYGVIMTALKGETK